MNKDTSKEAIDHKLGELRARFLYQFQTAPVHYEFPDGWTNLFAIVCCATDELLEQHGLFGAKQKAGFFRGWAQVKSRFAAARFYTYNTHNMNTHENKKASKAFNEMIKAAAELSTKLCEDCGAQGAWRSIGSWEIIACDKHYEERKQRRNRY